jgi:hypothetical protein
MLDVLAWGAESREEGDTVGDWGTGGRVRIPSILFLFRCNLQFPKKGRGGLGNREGDGEGNVMEMKSREMMIGGRKRIRG